MYCGWRPIQRVFRLKRRKRALIGREQTTGSAGGSDFHDGIIEIYKSDFEKVSEWDTTIQDTMEEYDNVER